MSNIYNRFLPVNSNNNDTNKIQIENKDINFIEKEKEKENINNKKIKPYSIKNDIDMFINYLYIFIITILLINSVLKRDKDSLLHTIILTLIYIFYKILINNFNKI